MMKFLGVLSPKNLGANKSVFGSYLWVSFSTKSVCRFLFCYVLVCGLLLYIFCVTELILHLQLLYFVVSCLH